MNGPEQVSINVNIGVECFLQGVFQRVCGHSRSAVVTAVLLFLFGRIDDSWRFSTEQRTWPVMRPSVFVFLCSRMEKKSIHCTLMNKPVPKIRQIHCCFTCVLASEKVLKKARRKDNFCMEGQGVCALHCWHVSIIFLCCVKKDESHGTFFIMSLVNHPGLAWFRTKQSPEPIG